MLLSAQIACFNKTEMLILKKNASFVTGKHTTSSFFPPQRKVLSEVNLLIICRVPMASLARREKVEKV